MIVASFDPYWEIYFHKAHALLAMDIGLSIDHYYWPERKYLAAGLASIAEHDNNQPRWNGRDNLTPEGYPLDYRDRREVDLRQAKSVVNSAQYKSSFVALMVSLHCHNLYRESINTDVQKFLKEQQSLRKQYIGLLNLDPSIIFQSYEFLRFCDDMSLALCQKEVTPKNEVQIKSIRGNDKVSLMAKEDGSFTIQPWIFYEKTLTFPVEYYLTSKKKFNSDEELKQDLDLEKPMIREFVFIKHESP